MDEAVAIAQDLFYAGAREHLSSAEIEEAKAGGAMSSGSPREDWEAELGFAPDMASYYEVEFYLRTDECPYIAASYALFLVGRDRSKDEVWVRWKPPVKPYTGPWFS